MDKPFTAQMSFAGHTALVTGGDSGIGFAKIWGDTRFITQVHRLR